MLEPFVFAVGAVDERVRVGCDESAGSFLGLTYRLTKQRELYEIRLGVEHSDHPGEIDRPVEREILFEVEHVRGVDTL